MNNRPNCKAYQRGDQYFCDQCGFVWDINDDDPPECVTKPVVLTGHDAIMKIKENLNRE